MLNNTKIGPKLIGGFAIASLITLVVGLMGLRGVTVLNNGDDLLFGSGVLGLEHLAKANIVFLRNRSRIQNMIRINTPEYTSSGEKSIEKYMKEMAEHLTEFEKSIPTDGIRTTFKELMENHPAFLKDLDEIRGELKSGKAEEAAKVFDLVDTQSWEKEKQAIESCANTLNR